MGQNGDLEGVDNPSVLSRASERAAPVGVPYPLDMRGLHNIKQCIITVYVNKSIQDKEGARKTKMWGDNAEGYFLYLPYMYSLSLFVVC